VPARKNEPDAWWSEEEAAPASGGHISPADPALAERLSDSPGGDSQDQETPGESEAAPSERTEVIPRGRLATADMERTTTPARARSARRRSTPVRRVRRTLRHIDPLSVLKLSLVFYGCFLIAWLLFVGVLYALLASTGVFDAVEKLGRTAVLWRGFDISLWLVERWALLIGASFAVLASLVNVFIAFVYNLSADVVGGMQLTFVERDL
jgi:hypothetical protein